MKIFNLIIIVFLICTSCSKPKKESLEKIIQEDNVTAFQNIRQKIDMDTISFFNGRNILHASIENFSAGMQTKLIEEEYHLNAIDSSGQTPLLLAIIAENKDAQKLLLNKSIDLNIVDNLNGYNALHYAIRTSDIDLFNKLIKKGVDYNIKTLQLDRTPLHIAIDSEQVEMVKVLLQKEVIDTIQDINDDTAIDVAITSNSQEIKDLFFDKFSVENKKSMLLHEIRQGNDEELTAKLLKEKWVSKKFINDAFIFSTNTTISNMLLEKGASLGHTSSEYGYAAIHYAAIRGDITMIEFLLSKGANINQVSIDSKKSPLMYASDLFDNFNSIGAEIGGMEIQINPIFYDQLGMSKEKTKENSLETVKFLIDKKVNLHFKNKNQENALYLAESSNNIEVASFLKEKGIQETKKYEKKTSSPF